MLRLVVVILVMLGPLGLVDGALARGTVTIEATDATAHDLELLGRVARDLETHWDRPRSGTKTFRLITYASGGVRGLTELDSTMNDVVACKLLRARLWPLKLKATAKRKLVVTFRFKRR